MRESIEANYFNKELKERYLREKETMLSIPANYIDVQFRGVRKAQQV